MALFEVTEYDRAFYERHLKDFLPQKIFDVHCHIYLEKFRLAKTGDPSKRVAAWPEMVAKDNPLEDLQETYRLLFPDQEVNSLFFASCTYRDDIVANNAYVAQAAAATESEGLYYSRPAQTAEDIERQVMAGGFLGLKSYLDMAPSYLPGDEIRVFDFFPPHQLEVCQQHGWIVMLHIPRSKRFRDPVNLAQIREIKKRYPHVKLIVAHVGRAYCPEDVGNAFEYLADCEDLLFDFSANCCAPVLEQALRAVGPKRMLFGSDMPILRMRTHRIVEHGTYINLIPPGLYGDPSLDPHMREVSLEEAERITFFLYEECFAMKQAAEKVGLTKKEIGDVFGGNARALIREVKERNKK